MSEPIIDPVTGKPKGENNTPPGGDFKISPEEWGEMKGRLDTFEKLGLGAQQPVQPATPPAPAGPSFEQQISDIDKGIDTLDAQIDEAIKENQPVSKLMRERDALTARRTRLQIKHEDIDPAFKAGIETIDQLSDTVTRGQMPYLEIVRFDYDAALASIPADQRMNPKMRQAAYNIAVGQNITKIMEAEKEAALRKETENPPEPGSSSREEGNDQDTIPKPEDVLSKDAMRALRNKGVSVDDYYRSRGYEGWEDFYKKTGKDYFEG